jgi:hypothetical protein
LPENKQGEGQDGYDSYIASATTTTTSKSPTTTAATTTTTTTTRATTTTTATAGTATTIVAKQNLPRKHVRLKIENERFDELKKHQFQSLIMM